MVFYPEKVRPFHSPFVPSQFELFAVVVFHSLVVVVAVVEEVEDYSVFFVVDSVGGVQRESGVGRQVGNYRL